MSKKITSEYVKSILDYDPDTGNFYWKTTRHNAIKVGQKAGCPHPEGYIHIKINGKNYKGHQLAYLIMTGKWPILVLDHKNSDDPNNQSNNSWGNIRESTRSQNRCNTTKQKNNKSGYKGVSWNKNMKKYVAQIQVRGIKMHLGYFDSKEAAAKAYNEAALKYHGEFAYLNKID